MGRDGKARKYMKRVRKGREKKYQNTPTLFPGQMF